MSARSPRSRRRAALDLDIPGDVSIVGFDDFDWMCALRPYPTTVAQPVDDFASSAWRLLMQRLSGGENADDIRDRASLRLEGEGVNRARPPAP